MLKLSRNVAANRILDAHGLGPKRYPNPIAAMRALVAVQTQYPASLGPALAARANGVTDKWVQNALRRKKTFLKAWNLRATLHTMLPEDHMLLLAALQSHFHGRSGAQVSPEQILAGSRYAARESYGAVPAGAQRTGRRRPPESLRPRGDGGVRHRPVRQPVRQ